MAIAIIVGDRDVSMLKQHIKAATNGKVPIWIYPDIPQADKVEMLVVWKHPENAIAQFPNVQLISSLGAGVEHIIKDPAITSKHLISRIVDPTLAHSMQKHVLTCVLHFHKQWPFYQVAKQNGQWAKPNPIERPIKVGILGVGALGQAVAKILQTVGFEVIGFSRKPKEIPNFTVWDSENHSLPSFLQEINVLLSLLPRTPQTEGILSYELLRNLPKGSCLINVGRGAHLVEDDLLKLLEEGTIDQAYLDVFQEEPLPTSHPFWSHSHIFITPHTASITHQENAAKIIADNYQRLKTGGPIRFEVQLDRGY